ncbi:RHS repeat-associated protein [Xanthomonas arboricola]|uniref:RHS repeat-associated core domain-containing protein n=1 Tax=Xanthomonas sp. 3793 TaxID=3035312 RepID=UPI0021697565|nr:RHS repeat-associated core domain-containing protein [Xanthomonas sp. 3793]MCS3745651.1 RHS repeat-associated protein [Xanthomonas sp. 3793]
MTAANPVNIFTGVKLESSLDYRSPLGGLEFTRYYTSVAGLRTVADLGNGWRHSYARSIDAIDASTVKVNRASGDSYIFKKRTGVWLRDQDVPYQLTEVSDPGSTGARWVLNTPDRTVESFNTDGHLIQISWPNGDIVSLSYANGLLQSATDKSGRIISFIFQQEKITTVSLPDKNSLNYQYDDNKNLSTVWLTDDQGARHLVSRYGYAASDVGNVLTKHYDETNTLYASWEYDTLGRVIRSVHGDIAGSIDETTFSYAPNGTTLKDSAGNQVVAAPILMHGRALAASFTGLCPTCNGKIFASRTYDSNGYPDIEIDLNGIATDWDYSPDGLVMRKSEAIGATSKGQRVTETTWDTGLRIPLQQETSSPQDGVRLRVNFTYNGRGQLVTTTRTNPIDNVVRTIDQAYCEQEDVNAGICPLRGLLTLVDGAKQGPVDAVTYRYYMADSAECAFSSSRCPHRKGDLWKVANALGQVIEYLAYDGAGRPLSIKDANGIVTDYSYHPRGWLTATKVRGADASSEADDRITRIDYWPTGLVKQVTQPDGAFTAFTYDAAHRLTDITDNAGNTVHYTLDNAGNRVKEDTKDAAGTLKRTLSRVYNELGQLKTQATAEGDPTDFGYDANGNTTAVTDALGTATQSEYDPLNRLSRTLQDVAGIKAGTTFDYDALDNLTKVTDPKGLDTKYEYNGFGDLVKLTSPDTGVTSYTYDSAGNRATQTDARGNTTAYGYDALNRLTKVTYPTTSLNVIYTYDVTQTACASGETFSIGRLTKMQDGGAITQYCYNRFGDLVRKVQTSNGKALVLRYDYTVGGQLHRMTYPDGAVVDYVRNTQGQTTEVAVTPAGGSRQVLLGNVSYYPFGPAAGWTYGNGRTLARQYDLDYHPQAIQDTRPGGLEVGFGFDPVGNLTALTPAGNATPEIGLGYDTLGRLTGLKDGRTGTLIDGYSYDATGNRLSAKVGTATQAYTYPADSHRLSAVAGVARSYDATGNTTAIGGTARQYTYDTTGRMTQARRAGAVTMNYRYNGRGEQVRRFLGTTNTYTLYDEAGHWLGDYDTSGAPKQQAIWLDDLPVGLLANANTLHYIEPDHLGSPRVVIDPTRDVAVWTWSLKGEAFGNTAPNQDPDGDGAALVLDMRFPGQRYDAASGLNQNYFRDYEAATGRYGQSDPIGLRGGISTFGYALQTPFVHMDFYGLATWKGSTFGVGVGAGKFGLNIDFYQVTSPCPGGGLAYAYVMAFGGAGGLGAPISMAGSQVELTDSNDVPDPDVFNGPYAKFSAGSVSFGLGYQMYQKISIGGAWWNFGAGAESTGWHQSQGGFDATVYGAAAGNAVVIQQKKCSCEAQ